MHLLGSGSRSASTSVLLGSALVAALGLSIGCGGSPPAAPPGVPQNPPMKDPTMAMFDEGAPAATPAPSTPSATPSEPVRLVVKMEARSGSKLSGQAILTETANGVKVELTVENGGAPGPHGAHIHEKGDCSAPDAKSAGDHFNPEKHDHALPAKDQRHLGDLGNIEIGKDGKGSLTLEIPGANLKVGDPKSFRGRGVIVHEKKDDGGQPVGNAGPRIGCGVIPS